MKRLAPFMVILAASLWGCLGLFVRQLNQCGLGSLEIVAIRMWGAWLVMGLFLLIYNRNNLKIHWRDIWCFLGTGVLSIVFFNYCYFTTIQLTSLSVAAILLYTAPAFVTVLGIILFGESFQLMKIVSLGMAFAGCVLVSGVLTNTDSLTTKGILLGIGSGFGYAMYSIFGRYAIQRGYSSVTISVYTFFFGALGSTALIRPGETAHKLMTHPECLSSVACLVLLGTMAAYVLYTMGLSRMEAGRASILACVEPVVATLIGFLLYKERLQPVTIAGVALVLASAILVSIPAKKVAEGTKE